MSISDRINLFAISDPKIKTLHITWFAFFLTFMVWFNHAPLLAFMKEAFDLSSQQVKALMILNVALTIPARILIGILVDKIGPRKVYSALLITSGFICLAFAFAQNYQQLALLRFLMGFVGAGFVIGIRMIGEWFPHKSVGIAEGIYGGWGNFGSAASAMLLPTLALLYGGEDGWRYAIATTGVVAGLYGVFYYRVARNTPKGSTYFKPKKSGGLEVTSRRDLYLYLLMNIPMYIALGVLSWKLSPSGVALIGINAMYSIWLVLVVLFVYQTHKIWQVNREHLKHGVPDQDKYQFKQVAILNWAYFVTFGSELAVVSMLPLFFLETFVSLDPVKAGLLASGFAFMNLVARPTGGWFSDYFGRRRSLLVLIGGLGMLSASPAKGSARIWMSRCTGLILKLRGGHSHERLLNKQYSRRRHHKSFSQWSNQYAEQRYHYFKSVSVWPGALYSPNRDGGRLDHSLRSGTVQLENRLQPIA